MKILVACECSQRITTEYRKLGYEAYSCDIKECEGAYPQYHIKGDCFDEMDKNHYDLIIAHPPCTYLSKAGARYLYYGSKEYRDKRRHNRSIAIQFFMRFVRYAEVHPDVLMAIENPPGIMSVIYRKPDFTYNPYDFDGETMSKRTCIWLFNGLQPLILTRSRPIDKSEITYDIQRPRDSNGKCISFSKAGSVRSVTPLGVAKAIAAQWNDNAYVQISIKPLFP